MISVPFNMLNKIIANKVGEIRRAKAETPLGELQRQLPDAPPVRDFFAALAGVVRSSSLPRSRKQAPRQVSFERTLML